jgi:hypothetical protein
MTSAQLTYGEAKEVARFLLTSNVVTHDDVSAALCNAMQRIDQLEKAVRGLGTSLDLLSNSLIHYAKKS